jgi:hypothetical protein
MKKDKLFHINSKYRGEDLSAFRDKLKNYAQQVSQNRRGDDDESTALKQLVSSFLAREINKEAREKAEQVSPSGVDKKPSAEITKLPFNHFTPNGATPVDLRKLTVVPQNTTLATLFSFTVPQGFIFIWNHYALFNDALLTDQSYFRISVNNNPVLRYHGDPNDDFKLSLGATADLGNNGLIEAGIIIQPNQTLKVEVINTDNVDVTMGCRVKGYVDNANKLQPYRFGG